LIVNGQSWSPSFQIPLFPSCAVPPTRSSPHIPCPPLLRMTLISAHGFLWLLIINASLFLVFQNPASLRCRFFPISSLPVQPRTTVLSGRFSISFFRHFDEILFFFPFPRLFPIISLLHTVFIQDSSAPDPNGISLDTQTIRAIYKYRATPTPLPHLIPSRLLPRRRYLV